MATVVYPGSFDPITNGHVDLIQPAARLFRQVIVGVARNINKQPLFSLEERMDLVRAAIGDLPNVRVMPIDGLLVDFVTGQRAQVILRGLRAVSDFERPHWNLQRHDIVHRRRSVLFQQTFVTSQIAPVFARALSMKCDWPLFDGRSTLYHYGELFPSLQDLSDFYFTMENGVRLKILGGLTSGFQVTTRYNNRPPADKLSTDNLHLFTLGYAFDTTRKR